MSPRRKVALAMATAAIATMTLAVVPVSAAAATRSCSRKVCDTSAPTLAFGSPGSGATVSGTVLVKGTSVDNVGVASVSIAVDGGAWQAASGTSSWSWSWITTGLSSGAHTLTARATDASGNAGTVSETVNVANPTADTTAPTLAIASPSTGATVSGSVSVGGSAGDNVSVSTVALAVDGGNWQTATGTTNWTWTWNTTGLADGGHTVSARAADGSGNTSVVSRTVTVSNPTPDTTPPAVAFAAPTAGATVSGAATVTGTASDNVAVTKVEFGVDGGTWQTASGTTSWTVTWNTSGLSNGAHTLATRATDGSGNVATASETVTVSNSANAPNTQGTWVSPEGVTIIVNSAGAWTIAQIYSILTSNALDLDKVGRHLTINVQDQYTSQTQSSPSSVGATYTDVKSTMWLQGVSSGFAARPDSELTHEYGHAWSMYWYYVAHQGSWSGYPAARWTTSDGSLDLATDSRTNSTYSWDVNEIVADDYRLLFGSSSAVSERPTHLNNQIPDPRNVAGLRDFLYNAWRTA